MEGDIRVWDDVTGNKLNHEVAVRVREEGIDFFPKEQVRRTVSEENVCKVAWTKTPAGTKWIDVDKGSEGNPECWSQVVAQRVKCASKETDIFAATPPLEA